MEVLKDNNFIYRFVKTAEKNADTDAIVFNNRHISYFELISKSDKIASYLSKMISDKNQIVGVKMERGPESIIAIAGILRAGHAYLPLDSVYPEKRLKYMIQQSGCLHIVFSGAKILHIENVEFYDYNLIQDEDKNEFETIYSDKNDIVYTLFTSGSTGEPKGVLMPYKAMNNLLNWQEKQSSAGISTKTLQFAPFSFDVSFQEIFSTLCSGGTLVIASEEERKNPELLLKLIRNEKIERIILPNIALQVFAAEVFKENVYLPELKEIITSGEQLKITQKIKDLIRLTKADLINQYGPTESHVITSHRLNRDDISQWPDLPPIGKPIDNCKVYLLDKNMIEVMPGTEAEMYLAGEALAISYVNRPDLTDEKFIANPNNPDEKLYKSGDIGKINKNGDFEFIGRKDEQVKIRGYRIELSEIEIQLAMIEGISEAAVMANTSASGNIFLIAYLLTSREVLLHEIKAHLAQQLPEFMLPSFYVFVDHFPKTNSGKLDKKSLPKPVNVRNLPDKILTLAITSIQTQLHDLWKDMLMLNELGIDDNVFDLGANSIICIQTSALIEEITGKKLPVVKIYQYPTIRQMAEYLDDYKHEKKVAETDKAKPEYEGGSIAIIGMALRFPGASDQFSFWDNLVNGRESITFFNDEELDASIDSILKKNPDYVKAKGIIDDAECFDASFFGINPQLAKAMDPQQRKFLELAWECLEDAGYSGSDNDINVGVFAGSGNNTYFSNNVFLNKQFIEQVGDFQVMTANEKDYIATRVSYLLNLTGPSISVYTACSTSLTAVIQACQSLRNHQCDMALAGGSAITSPVKSGYLYNEGSMLSKDGHCRPFDVGANGTPFSDGAGIVMLKRLEDAIADKDQIYAVVKGTGINNDGSDKASFTAPGIEGQSKALKMAIDDAGIEPATVSYIEAHGTATPIGDPIEIEAINLAYPNINEHKARLIGSVKSNFGHLTAAAGIAGLIKVSLALKNKTLPPTINFNKPNPNLNLIEGNLQVCKQLTP